MLGERTARRLSVGLWIAAIAMAGAYTLGLIANRHFIHPSAYLGEAATSYPFMLGASTIGALAARRRPSNPVGWMLLVFALVLSTNLALEEYAIHGLLGASPHWPGAAFAAQVQQWGTFVFFPYPLTVMFLLFPDGRLASRRFVPVAWAVGGLWVLSVVSAMLVRGAVLADCCNTHLLERNPIGVPGAQGVEIAGFVAIVFALPAAAISLVHKARRGGEEVRHQVRWLAYVIGLGALGFAAALVAGSIEGFSQPSSGAPNALFSVAIFIIALGVPVSVGIAILKYRLYDIDVVINKTVVYALLAAFITLVYAGVVVGIGSLVGNRRNPLLSALAAALVAVAFQPVRTRAGKLANRVVYGRRATPYEVLSDFAEQIGGAYAFEEILPRMAEIVASGTGAARAVVWLRIADGLRPEAASDRAPLLPALRVTGESLPAMPTGEHAVAIAHDGELLGAISIRMPRGEVLTPAGERLLADVASQGGLVLRNVRLIEELRASRQRIVAAQDAAARRLERNLHDGAQQQLVAIAMKQRLLEGLVRTDPERAAQLAAQLQGDTTDALENLRDLARGIYPPLLADRGLAVALEAQVRRSAVPITLRAIGLDRYPQEAEAAIYFCTLEALQNVAKYALATTVDVDFAERDGMLRFTVRDNGVGFDPSARKDGTGMQGMADRLAAQGGGLRVTSAPGAGTTVEGFVPVRRS